jgi:mRNA-degrading endonuclease RelE of RelBE toxin-antitoxin system
MKKWKIRFTPESSRLLSKLQPDNKGQVKQALTELQKS